MTKEESDKQKPAEHKHEKKPKRHTVIWLAVASGLAVILLTLHFTPLRYWQDPLVSAHELFIVKTANTDIQRANVHLSIAEKRYRDFTSLKKTSPHSSLLQKKADEMVAHDDGAMMYMDRAKKSNLNIKSLITRLCDDLDAQYKVLENANISSAYHVGSMSDYTWKIEASIDGSGKFNEQLFRVKAGLDKAMLW